MLLKDDGTHVATHIEYAIGVVSMMRGLMFRRDIPNDYAMIFVFPKPGTVSVHTLFMRFPIDVIFLNKDKIITDIARLNPWTGYRRVRGVAYFIEMNAGTLERYGLVCGSQLVFDADR
ncbi:MAG: DUF192 domain-containing protein [Euryarchaeota archaeon]|nr:DUF192 domain-containing protein [Euryarchaeota archaeon]